MRDFYSRSTNVVVQDLLGKVIVCRGKEVIITETEAYLGPEDLASHARFGPTERTKVMWERGGLLYVYFIYGMYEMTNIVTGPEGNPGAVLIRAGINLSTGEHITGPGLFSRYLGITRQDKGVDLVPSPACAGRPTLFIEDRGIVPSQVVTTPRIGVAYAGECAKEKLRFVATL